jgi:putative oxidoreductase
MRTLSLSPLSRLASLAPLAVRVIAGIIMLAHGWQKLTEMGPGNFGGQMLGGLGVPCRCLWGTW